MSEITNISKTVTWDDVKDDPNAIRISEYGFVVLKEVMGSDATIAESARVSYGDGTKKTSNDRALIRYLINHEHTSPLEMCEARFLISLPLFVSNQILRHRAANLNQLSGRYSIMPDEFFVPTELNIQSKDNKQGRAETVHREVSDKWAEGYAEVLETAKKHYDWAISEGISREQARIGLPLSQFTQMYWKMDLHNLMHFLRLRMDPHAQQETRDYANAIYSLLKPRFPIAMEAFDDYKLHAKKFSRMEIEILKSFIDPSLLLCKDFDSRCEKLGISKRELIEFVGKLS